MNMTTLIVVALVIVAFVVVRQMGQAKPDEACRFHAGGLILSEWCGKACPVYGVWLPGQDSNLRQLD